MKKRWILGIALAVVIIVAIASGQTFLLIPICGIGFIAAVYLLVFRLLWHAGSRLKSH